MTPPSNLVAPLAPSLWTRQDLDAGYRALLAERDAALLAARESAHAVRTLGDRIRIADNYLLTVADDTDIGDLRLVLRGLLTGKTREPGRDTD